MRNGNAIASIVDTIEGRFFVADIKKLPGVTHAAERRRFLPATSILGGMSKQLGNGIPANTILQNLLNGNIIDGPPESIRAEQANLFHLSCKTQAMINV